MHIFDFVILFLGRFYFSYFIFLAFQNSVRPIIFIYAIISNAFSGQLFILGGKFRVLRGFRIFAIFYSYFERSFAGFFCSAFGFW